jgi:2-oxoglutarate dehydrogenase complex dehydrogenase (E1) component-like enzyme
VYRLVRAFYSHGHLKADVDPLNMRSKYANDPELLKKFRFASEKDLSILDYRTYGFTEQDLEKTFYIDLPNQGAILSRTKDWKLKDLIAALDNAYCKKIGVEFNHMTDKAQRDWIRQKFENIQYETLDEATRIHMFRRLNAS